MAKKLIDLANPVRVSNVNGREVRWKPLTLADLAAIEAEHGNIVQFFQSAIDGSITPILVILHRAIANAVPDVTIEGVGGMFLAGDLLGDSAPAATLLQEIMEGSGLRATVETGQKKGANPNGT